MEFHRQGGIATDLLFPMIKAGSQDFAASADWTPVAGDVKISKDGAAAVNTTNLPAAISSMNAWKLTLTSGEMGAKWIIVTIVDSATKAVEDQALLVLTKGDYIYGLDEWQMTQETGLTFRGALRLITSAILGNPPGGAPTPLTFKAPSDTKNRITATVDSNGNRTAMTVDPD